MNPPEPPPSHRSLGVVMLSAGWLIIMVVLGVFFSDMLDHQENPNRHPTGVSTNQYNEVILMRNRHHHYVADGTINGHTVTFLVDTGATHVAVPPELAGTLGLKPGQRGIAHTANGMTETALTRIDTLTLGTITLNDVRASITYGMSGNEILLGMSALKNVDFIQQNGELTLRQHR